MLFALLFRNKKVHCFGGRRLHHGWVGLWLAVAGILLMLDDIADVADWHRDWRNKWH